MTNTPLILETTIGDRIQTVAEKAVALADKYMKTVQFDFNDHMIEVLPGSKPEDAVNAYHKSCEAKYEAYRASPEGQAAAERMKQEALRNQETLDALRVQLPDAIAKGITSTVQWLRDYSDPADYAASNAYTGEVLKALQDAGYQANACTGDNFVKGHKKTLGLYIVGQAMDCLQKGMPPHPILTKFADEYLQMPDRPRLVYKPQGRK